MPFTETLKMGNKDIKIIDIEDFNQEFKKLDSNFSILYDSFIAIGLDYKNYIDNSWGEEKIFELRDSVQYRFLSTKLHLELLIKQHYIIKKRFEEIFKTNPEKILGQYLSKNPYFGFAEQEISSIFDSIIYHIVSIFDYLSTLTNYICGKTKSKYLKWTQLAKSARDPNNEYSNKYIRDRILDLDKSFVNKLYDYRSFLIHKDGDICLYSIGLTIDDNKGEIDPNFAATKRLVKHFNDLKVKSENEYYSLRYVAFWLTNETIRKTIDYLLDLKTEMEKSSKQMTGWTLGYLDKESNIMRPASYGLWRTIINKINGT